MLLGPALAAPRACGRRAAACSPSLPLRPRPQEQRSHFRHYNFALAFENRVCVDYVTGATPPMRAAATAHTHGIAPQIALAHARHRADS